MDRNVTKEIRQEHNGRTYSFPLGVLARNVETDSDHRFLTDGERQNLLDTKGGTVEFETEPAGRELLKSGSRPGKLFAQINRWLRDFKTVSFTGSYTDLINLPTLGTAASKGVSSSMGVTQEGYVADARVIKTINDKFGGIRFELDGDDIYAVYENGGSEVMKRIGSSGASVVEVGTYTGDETVKVTAYPEYRELTTNNFYIAAEGISIKTTGIGLTWLHDTAVSKTYNAATGTLTVSGATSKSEYTDDGGDIKAGEISIKYTVFIVR